MSSLTKWSLKLKGCAVVATCSAGIAVLSDVQPAHAQAAYGSYVGLGAAVGFTNDSAGRGDNFSGVIAGRYKILEAPISIRGQALVFGSTAALVPTVSYDFPISWQMDAYVGAGVSFPTSSGGIPSPVGDQFAFVLQPGVDYAIPNSNMVVFGNAIFAFDAYSEGGGMATSLQGGLGIQF